LEISHLLKVPREPGFTPSRSSTLEYKCGREKHKVAHKEIDFIHHFLIQELHRVEYIDITKK